MAVKVFIRRHCRQGRLEAVLDLLREFRKAAMDQPGYVSGETLVNHYDPRRIIVVSAWKTVEDWIRWQSDESRERMEARIEDLLDQATAYEIFDIHGGAGSERRHSR